ncbi:extracellular solute-binding protein [Neobacillus muris]|uniref:ABC transporter substrate-binding protein n=1 Tax=Neobacillus muris TaxID=2941334 RepID=UPI00203FD545|nr:extracellular solute-binding protein [Neobacillus muris]
MAKIFKKLAFLVAIVTAATSFLTACSDKSTSSSESSSKSSSEVQGAAMKDYAVGKTFKATKPLTFTSMYNDASWYAYKKDWLLWSEITKRTNVSLDLTIVPMSDYNQKRSLLISSGDAPLIIPKTYPGQETPYVASGAILPISDYVKYMPNFLDKVKKWNLQPEIDNLRQADGKYYLLPGLHEEVWPDYTLAIRTDIFEKNNIAVPKTWDEFEAALKKLKEAYPDITPFSDRWSTSGNGGALGALLNYAAPTFGTVGGFGTQNYVTYNEDKEKFEFAGATKEYKEMLTYFNKLIKEGLMDKESLSQSDDQAKEKFVTGKSFVISTNAQELEVMRTAMDQNLGKGNYSIAKIAVPGGPNGQVMSGSRLENGIVINAKAKDDPNFIALLQFVDWLWYSDEGEELAKWGVEGTTYKKENGKYTLMPDVNYLGLNPAGTKDLRVDYGFGTGTFAYGGTTELLQSTMSEEEIKFQNEMAKKKALPVAPPYPMEAMDQEQATLLVTPLVDTVRENTAKFILGSRSLSEWDKYVDELNAKGMDKYIDMINKAHEDYEKKMKK